MEPKAGGDRRRNGGMGLEDISARTRPPASLDARMARWRPPLCAWTFFALVIPSHPHTKNTGSKGQHTVYTILICRVFVAAHTPLNCAALRRRNGPHDIPSKTQPFLLTQT